MSFLRLSRWHAIAAIAALVLLVSTALDWYTTDEGEEARRIEGVTEPLSEDPTQRQFDLEVVESSSILAEQNEHNAWQPDEALDWVVLVLLLVTIALALAVAVIRAADRGLTGTVPPSTLVAALAALTALLVVVRIVDVGAIETGGEVEPGAPVALVALGLIAYGAARAAREDRAAGDTSAPHDAERTGAAAAP
jgi:hypothetical protein